jgi:hypothetical protein
MNMLLTFFWHGMVEIKIYIFLNSIRVFGLIRVGPMALNYLPVNHEKLVAEFI